MSKFKAAMKKLVIRIAEKGLAHFLMESDRREKCSYATKIAQQALFLNFREMQGRGYVPPLVDVGYRVFSEADEDGILVFVFSLLGTYNKSFVDLGSSDGINSNCANLAINFGWYGLFVDGNQERVDRGKAFYGKYPDTRTYPPKFSHTHITRGNVNECIRRAGGTVIFFV